MKLFILSVFFSSTVFAITPEGYIRIALLVSNLKLADLRDLKPASNKLFACDYIIGTLPKNTGGTLPNTPKGEGAVIEEISPHERRNKPSDPEDEYVDSMFSANKEMQAYVKQLPRCERAELNERRKAVCAEKICKKLGVKNREKCVRERGGNIYKTIEARQNCGEKFSYKNDCSKNRYCGRRH